MSAGKASRLKPRGGICLQNFFSQPLESRSILIQVRIVHLIRIQFAPNLASQHFNGFVNGAESRHYFLNFAKDFEPRSIDLLCERGKHEFDEIRLLNGSLPAFFSRSF